MLVAAVAAGLADVAHDAPDANLHPPRDVRHPYLVPPPTLRNKRRPCAGEATAARLIKVDYVAQMGGGTMFEVPTRTLGW